jgi:hypothetical protein
MAGYLSTRTPVRYCTAGDLSTHTPVTPVIYHTSGYLPTRTPKDMDTKCPDIYPGHQLHGFQNVRIFDLQNPNSSDTGCPDILAARTRCLESGHS